MGAALRIAAAALAAAVLLAVTALGALIGLAAECTGADCPHSHAWRATLLVTPFVAAVLLIVGAAWSAWRRRLWPLVLAIAVVLAFDALVDAALYEAGFDTAIVLAVSLVVGRAALQRA